MKAIEPHNFYGVLLGAAVAAVGTGISAYGTAQNAKATDKAAQYAMLLENNLAKKQQVKLDALVAGKEEKLQNVNTILDRFEGGGAFGSSGVLEDIRKAQSDFANLGAGDFTGFQDQLDSILKGTLANTYGSGSPSGTFTQLAADTIMNLRQGGLQSALATGEFLSRESQQLLGTEFGIMDQAFEQQYMLERNRVSGITGNQMISAQQQGIGTQALGGAITQIGGLYSNVAAYRANQANISEQQDLANSYQTRMIGLSERGMELQERYFGSMPQLSTPNFTNPGSGGGATGWGGDFVDPALPFMDNTSTPYSYWGNQMITPGAGTVSPFTQQLFSGIFSPSIRTADGYPYEFVDTGVLPPR